MPGRSLLVRHACRTFCGVDIALRSPRIRDAASWSETRREEQSRLEPRFPAASRDWAAEQTELAWLQRWLGLRTRALRGDAYPNVLVDVTGPGDSRIVGEVGIDRVDRRTRTGEISTWAATGIPATRVVGWAIAAVLFRAFTSRRALVRAVAALPVADREQMATVSDLGFAHELTLSGHRLFAGRPADHRIFVLHNTPESRVLLRERCV